MMVAGCRQPAEGWAPPEHHMSLLNGCRLLSSTEAAGRRKSRSPPPGEVGRAGLGAAESRRVAAQATGVSTPVERGYGTGMPHDRSPDRRTASQPRFQRKFILRS